MTSRQRVAGVLRGVIPDRVPIGEYAIDCDTVERVVGHETFLRAKAKSQIAFWDGRRDEVAQSWKEDLVELHRRLPVFDIVNLASQATALLPPAGLPRVRYRKPDDATYVLDTGDVYRYSEATRDLTLVERGRAAQAGSPRGAASAAAAPDPSCFEVYDALIAALPEKYLVGCSGPEVGLVELGDTEQTLLAYALEPELSLEAAHRQLAAANALDRHYLRPGIQAVLWGQDHAYLSGPMASPEVFRRLALPVYAARVRSVKSIMDMPIIKHACGNTWQLLDMYVEAGFDAYQSIQASAAMDLASVKRAYGDRLVLWGGVPLELLQGGTAGEVRAAVRAAVEVGRPGGRYILGSSHSIAVGSKYDNVMAMLDEYERVADY